MATNNLQISLVAIVIIAVFLFITALYWTSQFGKSQLWLNYITIVSSIALCLTVVSIVDDTTKQEEEQASTEQMQTLTLSQTNWTNLEKYISDHNDTLAPIYRCMNSNNILLKDSALTPLNKNCEPQSETADQRAKRIVDEAHLISMAIQACEDAWTIYGVDGLQNNVQQQETSGGEWYRTMVSWFKAPQFRKAWPTVKSGYNQNFAAFVDSNVINKKIIW